MRLRDDIVEDQGRVSWAAFDWSILNSWDGNRSLLFNKLARGYNNRLDW